MGLGMWYFGGRFGFLLIVRGNFGSCLVILGFRFFFLKILFSFVINGYFILELNY